MEAEIISKTSEQQQNLSDLSFAYLFEFDEILLKRIENSENNLIAS